MAAVTANPNDSAPMSGLPPASWAVVAFSTVLIALTVVSIGSRLWSPSDRSFEEHSGLSANESGVLIADSVGVIDELRTGDRVTAVGAKSILSWSQDLFAVSGFGSVWEVGQTVTYQVVRDGAPINVSMRFVGCQLKWDRKLMETLS